MPRKHRKIPPTSRSQCCWLMSNPLIAVRPKAAMPPYVASAVAAPKPEMKPSQRPSARVRRMHNMPMGPTGAATASPITTAWKKEKMTMTIPLAQKNTRQPAMFRSGGKSRQTPLTRPLGWLLTLHFRCEVFHIAKYSTIKGSAVIVSLLFPSIRIITPSLAALV